LTIRQLICYLYFFYNEPQIKSKKTTNNIYFCPDGTNNYQFGRLFDFYREQPIFYHKVFFTSIRIQGQQSFPVSGSEQPEILPSGIDEQCAAFPESVYHGN
jgi:hypothetical protein